MIRVHELWIDDDGGATFFLPGPRSDALRKTMSPSARLVRTFEAGCWFDAMTQYHTHMGWKPYRSDPSGFDEDGTDPAREPYPDDAAPR